MKIHSAEFVTSAQWPEHWPLCEHPEIAFAGRSNVGKSSLINTLCKRKRLVKTSGKPGHTRTINFFEINGDLSLVDLPGYGFARVSKKERDKWGEMIEAYLAHRECLRGVVCIVDIRRGFEEDDMMLIEAAPHFAFQPILVLTKADKLRKNRRKRRLLEIAGELGCPPEELILFSATEGFGCDEIWDRIIQLTGI
jgi:GTP-binding protein